MNWALPLGQDEMMTFFALLTRLSVMLAVFPIFGHMVIPVPVKVLLGLSLSVMLFPVLVTSAVIVPAHAAVWADSVSGIAGVIAREVIFGLALGFCVRLVMDAVQIGGDIISNFMGFSAAHTYDPQHETTTPVVAQVLNTLALLLFLTMDGHLILIQAAAASFKIVPIGEAAFHGAFANTLLDIASDTFKIGIQIGAPIAISIFAVNIVYAILSKAIPQLNVLVLSFAVSAGLGLFVLMVSMPETLGASRDVFDGLADRMGEVMQSLRR